MGIRLMVEILDHWQDVGLTAGEKGDLIVIAENASDETRETWPRGGMHQPHVLQRVGKSAAGWKNAVGKLMKKGVLNYAIRNGRALAGFPGQVAVYRISPLCPDPPHDGFMGQCKRDERVTSQVTQSDGARPKKGHLSGDPNPVMGHLSGGERVTSQVTPTPPYPSSTTPSSPTAPPSTTSAEAASLGGGGGGDADAQKPIARASAFVDALDYRGQRPTIPQRDKLIHRVAVALAAGWTEPDLTKQLDLGTDAIKSALAMYLYRLHESHLPEPPAPRPALRTVATRCPDCDERGFHYLDPVAETGAYRCPNTGQQTTAA